MQTGTEPGSLTSDRSESAGTRRLIAADLRAYGHGRGGIAGFMLTLLLVPGFSLLFQHRIVSRTYRAGKIGRLLALLLWRRSVRTSACHISPLADVGPALMLPHSTGVVIGDGVEIGSNVTIYQNVTVGARGSDGYPVIEDDVVIYPGAVVVGAVRIGRGARIGANAFVASGVASGQTVAGVPARPLRQVRTSGAMA